MNDAAVWRKHSEELVRYASILVGPSDAEGKVTIDALDAAGIVIAHWEESN